MPLEDVAARLGLELDKHDLHKWRGEGQIVSITGQKFYDHLSLKGGYGAIDLVMHVQGRNFKQAIDWLSTGANQLPPPTQRSQQHKVLVEQPFQPPVVDDSKWALVRQYLTEKRQLPATLVDKLHSQGSIYADTKQNAVFIRQNIEGKQTGASLRGTYKDSQFKGLATGSRRDGGWFAFTQGEGQLERVVLTESPIDAMSATANTKFKSGTTMFIATDGAGAIPIDLLQQHRAAGVQIIAAHDADRAGEEMAWKIAQTIPGVVRAVPTHGKDWNEQLLGKEERSPDPSEWKWVAQALGKSVAYIKQITSVIQSGQPLPEQARVIMQQDVFSYKQISNDLWQWHQKAKTVGETEAYQKRIAEVALAFHHPKQPTPLTAEAQATMQQDHRKLAYRRRYQELQQLVCQKPHFANAPIKEVDVAVAITAFKSSTQDDIGGIIAQSDQIKAWKQSMPGKELKLKAANYIHEVLSDAHRLRQVILQQKENIKQPKKRSQDLEL